MCAGQRRGCGAEVCRILKFVVGSFGLDSVLLTEVSDLRYPGVSSLIIIGGANYQT